MTCGGSLKRSAMRDDAAMRSTRLVWALGYASANVPVGALGIAHRQSRCHTIAGTHNHRKTQSQKHNTIAGTQSQGFPRPNERPRFRRNLNPRAAIHPTTNAVPQSSCISYFPRESEWRARRWNNLCN